MPATKTPLLSLDHLSIRFGGEQSPLAVQDLSFTAHEDSILGIVGESGSGKSITALAIMGLLPQASTYINGAINFDGHELLPYQDKYMQGIRGKDVAMIFQDPMTALNPSKTCGKQVDEMLRHHLDLSAKDAKNQTLKLFEQVRLPEPEQLYRRYPHQISGGQMQRVMIALAISCHPKLLIADEPTTALDVTVQKEIIQLLKDLQKETGMGMIFISHDLALVSEIAETVLVMHQGAINEIGPAKRIFRAPQSDYTKALIASRPKTELRLKVLPTVASIGDRSFEPDEITAAMRAQRHQQIYLNAPLLEVRQLKKHYSQNAFFWGKKQVVKAVDGVSFNVYAGETVGLVGESGCGKSTLVKTLLNLESATSGSVFYKGRDISQLTPKQWRLLRKEIQFIFQDPFSSLNPKITIGAAITEPMIVHGIGASDRDRQKRVTALLEQVGLDASYFMRYPHQLSGGQRQRVGIARAIALEPKLVICDESVSALDISVQAQVLNLLNTLKATFGFTYIFISHDLSVVKFMADQLLVMKQGLLEEVGDADEIYAHPKSPYTQSLIRAIPQGL